MIRPDFDAQSPTRAASGVALVATLFVTSLLAGCGSHEPTGQVVAVVNGQEITVQDLQAEARGVRSTADPKALLPIVVARTLLAQGAHKRNLDKYPGFPSDVTRLKQNFLADKMLAASVKPASPPNDSAVREFISSHPWSFAQRQALHVDLIKMQSKDAQVVHDLDTLDAVASRLQSLNIAFERGDATLDTASLPPELAQKLVAQSLGSFFTLGNGGTFIAGVINDRSSAITPPAEQMALARASLEKSNTAKRVADEVASLKRTAVIRYQPGYSPSRSSLGAPPAVQGAPAQ